MRFLFLSFALLGVPHLFAEVSQPNILFIYADDHSEAAISAYGSRINKTPHIDDLAAEGMRFTQSFVANSICGPSRATILTGAHSHINGKIHNRADFKDQLPTWPKLMQTAGYQTAAIGKWHLPTTPNGFDYWVKSSGYYVTAVTTSEGNVKKNGYTVDVLTETTLDWLKKRDPGKPFAIWLSHNAVHRTWMPGPKYLNLYDDVTIPEPATLFDDYAGRSIGAERTQMRISRDLFPAYDLMLPVTGKATLDRAARGRLNRMSHSHRRAWDRAFGPKNKAFTEAKLTGDELVRWKYQRYIKNYLRCVAAVDDSVGRLMAFLREQGLDKNTVVIYSSDQGFFLGEHGWYDKRWMYEPSLRTPLIVRWPNIIKPGTTCDRMVQNIDMAPTLLAMAGLEPSTTMQGESLVPLLKGERPKRWRDAIYYHYQESGSSRTQHRVAKHYGIRTERHKLIYVYEHNQFELYNLKEDPGEMRNLASNAAHAVTLKQLKGRLEGLRAEVHDTTGPSMP
jgi:arylsulfatase A-like enzyme